MGISLTTASVGLFYCWNCFCEGITLPLKLLRLWGLMSGIKGGISWFSLPTCLHCSFSVLPFCPAWQFVLESRSSFFTLLGSGVPLELSTCCLFSSFPEAQPAEMPWIFLPSFSGALTPPHPVFHSVSSWVSDFLELLNQLLFVYLFSMFKIFIWCPIWGYFLFFPFLPVFFIYLF